MLPPVHVAVVGASQIRNRLGEALHELSETPELNSYVHFVTGSSRSSDIENDQSRGIEDILILSVDNLKGFSEAIFNLLSESRHTKMCGTPTCHVLPQIRNSLKYVSYKDYKAVTSALKPIYKASTEDAALEELDHFEQT